MSVTRPPSLEVQEPPEPRAAARDLGCGSVVESPDARAAETTEGTDVDEEEEDEDDAGKLAAVVEVEVDEEGS